MPFTERNLARAQLGTTLGTLYTTGAGTTPLVKNIVLSNSDTVNRAASIWLVASGGTVAGSNVLLDQVSVPTKGIIDWSGFQVMGTGSTIQGSAAAANVIAVNIGGAEIT